MKPVKQETITTQEIEKASRAIKNLIKKTPLELSARLSEKYQAKIYLKREDLQKVRSFKLRGAYYFMSLLPEKQKSKGVVAASAGNHAQGVALSACQLKIRSTIFMPIITPLQKINKVRSFGNSFVEVRLVGKNFDECCAQALNFAKETGATFVHPFDDPAVIVGQGTVGKEIYDVLRGKIDYFLCPIGGGGLIAGAGTYLKTKISSLKIVGVEPEKADSMNQALKHGRPVNLQKLDTFVDGAAVKRVGDLTFRLASKLIDSVKIVPAGKICSSLIDLHQNEGIVAEPAGVLAISALEGLAEEIKDKIVVCILSGGNNDILRYPEIMEKSLLYEGLKHYFLVQFAQKPGQLKEFVNKVLGPTDDIVRFEYIKKTSKEFGPALVGVELQKREDYPTLIKKMDNLEVSYTIISENDLLYSYLV